jgi:hypothetical protein
MPSRWWVNVRLLLNIVGKTEAKDLGTSLKKYY